MWIIVVVCKIISFDAYSNSRSFETQICFILSLHLTSAVYVLLYRKNGGTRLLILINF